MLEDPKKLLRYYEPIKGLNASGEETVCCLIMSLTAEDAVMAERARRYDLGREEKLSDEMLLDEFMIHNWAFWEKPQPQPQPQPHE